MVTTSGRDVTIAGQRHNFYFHHTQPTTDENQNITSREQRTANENTPSSGDLNLQNRFVKSDKNIFIILLI